MSKRPAEPTTAEIAVRFVGERLRHLREARGLTQESMGARAGVTSKYISEIERGATSVSVPILWQLSVDGLGVPLTEFFMVSDDKVADDVATLVAVVGAQPPAVRQRALRVVRAVIDE